MCLKPHMALTITETAVFSLCHSSRARHTLPALSAASRRENNGERQREALTRRPDPAQAGRLPGAQVKRSATSLLTSCVDSSVSQPDPEELLDVSRAARAASRHFSPTVYDFINESMVRRCAVALAT